MYKLSTSYVYLVSDGQVYYSLSNYGLTKDISKASFFNRESDAKARITNMKKTLNKGEGLWVSKPYGRLKTFTHISYHTLEYKIGEPNVDFSA